MWQVCEVIRKQDGSGGLGRWCYSWLRDVSFGMCAALWGLALQRLSPKLVQLQLAGCIPPCC
mgnify:CR=1 FL=1